MKVKKKKPTKFKKYVPPTIGTDRESEFWTLRRNPKYPKRPCGLSVSSIQKFQVCSEQFRLEKAEGLRSIRDGSSAMDYGNLWQEMLSREYQGKAAGGLKKGLSVAKAVFYRDYPNVPEARRDDFELSLAKVSVLWNPYHAKWKKDDKSKKIEWVDVEKEFDVDYRLDVGPATILIPLRGYIDGVFRWNGKLWLLETKTSGRIDEADIEDTLHIDLQCMMYCWVLYKIYGEWPTGIRYNVIRNPGNKLKANQTYEEYCDHLKNAVEKDEDHYFKRWEHKVNKTKIQDWLKRQFEPMLTEVFNWAENNGPHYISEQNLTTKYGKSSMYGVIAKGDFTEVYRKSSTDKRKER